MSTLSKKAVLAILNISHWTARRFDRKVTEEVNRSRGATEDAGRYNKLLIAKEGLETIRKLVSRARDKHLEMTLPWGKDGSRILPTALYIEYTNTFRGLKNDFNAAADEFARNYPELMRDAERRLNGMFDQNDYPAPAQIRSLFDFQVQFLPCPDAGDFRADLAREHAEDIRAEIEEQMKTALNIATRDTVERMLATVGRMAERLRAYQPARKKGETSDGVFRDSLVENVRDLAKLLPAFNITGDQALAQIADRIAKELCNLDAQQLRDSDNDRDRVAAAAESILKDVQAFMA